MLTAIIVAAGSSQRMGFDKLFALLGDKPVVAHTLAAFQRTECVTDMILVGREEQLRQMKELRQAHKFAKLKKIVAGGEHRQDSVRAGLEHLEEVAEFVAVHDAARPLITPEQIERVFEICQTHGAAVLGEPVTDTLKRVTEDCLVCGSVEREKLYGLQTPQIFRRELLAEAYEFIAANKLTVTDETSAVQHLGRQIALVPTEDHNFKITYPHDLPLAEFILNLRQR